VARCSKITGILLHVRCRGLYLSRIPRHLSLRSLARWSVLQVRASISKATRQGKIAPEIGLQLVRYLGRSQGKGQVMLLTPHYDERTLSSFKVFEMMKRLTRLVWPSRCTIITGGDTHSGRQQVVKGLVMFRTKAPRWSLETQSLLE